MKLWTETDVYEFLTEHPVNTTWCEGRQVPKPLFSPLRYERYSSGYGVDAWYEIDIIPNFRHMPPHTLTDVLVLLQAAVKKGGVSIWNHPSGVVRLMFTESVDPGP